MLYFEISFSLILNIKMTILGAIWKNYFIILLST